MRKHVLPLILCSKVIVWVFADIQQVSSRKVCLGNGCRSWIQILIVEYLQSFCRYHTSLPPAKSLWGKRKGPALLFCPFIYSDSKFFFPFFSLFQQKILVVCSSNLIKFLCCSYFLSELEKLFAVTHFNIITYSY